MWATDVNGIWHAYMFEGLSATDNGWCRNGAPAGVLPDLNVVVFCMPAFSYKVKRRLARKEGRWPEELLVGKEGDSLDQTPVLSGVWLRVL